MNHFIMSEPVKCIGCHTCEVACVVAHEPTHDIENIDARTFTPRLHLIQTAQLSTPVTCHQCEDAPCVNVCPSKAIFYSRGTVQVNEDACFGCKNCVIACPFGAMDMITQYTMNMIAGITLESSVKVEAHKCDLCVNRASGPACVEVCPTKALYVMDNAMIARVVKERKERSVRAIGNTNIGSIADHSF